MKPPCKRHELAGLTEECPCPDSNSLLFQNMVLWLEAKKEAERLEGAKMFLGIPDRWMEHGPLFRCENGHVSYRVLKTDDGDKCLAGKCMGRTRITFPEDHETNPPTPIRGPI